MELSRSILLALLISLAVHGLLAVGLIVYLEYAPCPDVMVTLDLANLRLSFAEKVEETAAATPVPPSPPPEPVKPKSAEKPPEQKVEKLQAPDPLAPRFPEPKDEPEKIDPYERKVVPDQSRHSDVQTFKQLTPVAPAAPRQAHVDAPPSPKRPIRPDYPKGARQRGEQGEVTLEIHVDAEGAVSEAKVVVSSGFAELDEAAVRAVRKAKFRPAKSDKKAVASVARIKLDFKLK